MENGTGGPLIATHTFEEVLNDIPVSFHIMKLKDSIFLWIGDQGNFESLGVAMMTRFHSLPVSTGVMGHGAEDSSSALAGRLSKKTGKQVFASCNLSKGDSNLMIAVTQRLMKELNEHPERF